jgi:hypothetical protein
LPWCWGEEEEEEEEEQILQIHPKIPQPPSFLIPSSECQSLLLCSPNQGHFFPKQQATEEVSSQRVQEMSQVTPPQLGALTSWAKGFRPFRVFHSPQ